MAIAESLLPNREVDRNAEDLLKRVADAYSKFIALQSTGKSNFHGLRDFYHLIKAICEPTGSQIGQAFGEQTIVNSVYRNFGGNIGAGRPGQLHLRKNESSAQTVQGLVDEKRGWKIGGAPRVEVPSVVNLVCENLTDPNARHLMLISRGDAVVGLLKLPQAKTGPCRHPRISDHHHPPAALNTDSEEAARPCRHVSEQL